ncbi:MAG: NADH-binding protein, partial [Acidimicrobiia bacterium]
LGEDGDDLSAHLRSRREVEHILCTSAPTTALRAAIVVGDGGISWEILRQLVERLPVMLTPRWVETRTQPIALGDALTCLVGVLGRHEAIGRAYDIGGLDVTTYRDMLVTVARLIGRRRLIVPVPLLTPRLSSHWLDLVTDVDLITARSLVDSLSNEVVVREHHIESILGSSAEPYRPLAFSDAAAAALATRERRLRSTTHAPA